MKILKKYYKISGGKVTNFPEITYIYNDAGTTHAAIAEYLQSTLKEVGIKMTIKGYDWDDFSAKLRKGKFTIARAGWAADVNDANNFLENYVSGNDNNQKTVCFLFNT